MGSKQSNLAEKHDSSLDLIEKNLGENDLVYELIEIDIGAVAGKDFVGDG